MGAVLENTAVNGIQGARLRAWDLISTTAHPVSRLHGVAVVCGFDNGIDIVNTVVEVALFCPKGALLIVCGAVRDVTSRT